jgi:hypothetical protein
MGVHKKEAPQKLETRLPTDTVRAVEPAGRSKATTARVAAAVATGVLAAGSLMAALAPSSGAQLSDAARSHTAASRSLADSAEPAPLLASADGFPSTPVPTTVRLVPNPHPPRAVAGGMRAMPMPAHAVRDGL